MRYMILRYLRRANGQMDEQMEVTKKLRLKDHQTAAVVLDFRHLKVVQASLDGVTIPKDFDRIVGYYYQHYAPTIEQLFKANGHDISLNKSPVSNQ
jgi:hypothetical protein